MADPADELIDYEEDEETLQISTGAKTIESGAGKDSTATGAAGEKAVKKGYVGVHSTGFRDFLLKPELLRAIVDCGFEHPSEGTIASLLSPNLTLCLCSPTRMYPSGHPWYGCALSGCLWYG
jgi:hypothetical protein